MFRVLFNLLYYWYLSLLLDHEETLGQKSLSFGSFLFSHRALSPVNLLHSSVYILGVVLESIYLYVSQMYILSSWALDHLPMLKICISNCLQNTSMGCWPQLKTVGSKHYLNLQTCFASSLFYLVKQLITKSRNLMIIFFILSFSYSSYLMNVKILLFLFTKCFFNHFLLFHLHCHC